jgi:hypothetical protein
LRELMRAMAADPGIVRRAVKVSAVVGTVLNLVNQGQSLLDGGAISWPHALLNYVVPFCVKVHGAKQEPEPAARSSVAARGRSQPDR